MTPARGSDNYDDDYDPMDACTHPGVFATLAQSTPVLRDEAAETSLVDLRTQACPCCGTKPAPSEAELIEIDRRLSAIGVAEDLIAVKMAKAERKNGFIPYRLEEARQRLEALRDDVRRLIELARERGGA